MAAESPSVAFDQYRGLLAEAVVRKQPKPLIYDALGDAMALNVFFVESNGGADVDEFTWNQNDYQTSFNYIMDGMDFWGSLAWRYHHSTAGASVWLHSWMYGHTEVLQPYEPIRHRSDEEWLWVDSIMSNLGYNQPGTGQAGAIARVRAYNEDYRISRGATSAYSLFLTYNPANAPCCWNGGPFAGPWAWIGGPYAQILFRGFGDPSRLGVDVAHESGHIYWACDEYGSSGCGCTCAVGGPHGNTPNLNCANCGSAAAGCIMRDETSYNFVNRLICSSTEAQIGWPTPACIQRNSEISAYDWKGEYYEDWFDGANWEHWNGTQVR